MNPIKATGRAFRSQNGFTYVMDSTLWECDGCGDRVTFIGRIRHAKSCPERSFKSMIADAKTIGELLPAPLDPTGADHPADDAGQPNGGS